jgi:hypothetical protein
MLETGEIAGSLNLEVTLSTLHLGSSPPLLLDFRETV